MKSLRRRRHWCGTLWVGVKSDMFCKLGDYGTSIAFSSRAFPQSKHLGIVYPINPCSAHRRSSTTPRQSRQRAPCSHDARSPSAKCRSSKPGRRCVLRPTEYHMKRRAHTQCCIFLSKRLRESSLWPSVIVSHILLARNLHIHSFRRVIKRIWCNM